MSVAGETWGLTLKRHIREETSTGKFTTRVGQVALSRSGVLASRERPLRRTKLTEAVVLAWIFDPQAVHFGYPGSVINASQFSVR